MKQNIESKVKSLELGTKNEEQEAPVFRIFLIERQESGLYAKRSMKTGRTSLVDGADLGIEAYTPKPIEAVEKVEGDGRVIAVPAPREGEEEGRKPWEELSLEEQRDFIYRDFNQCGHEMPVNPAPKESEGEVWQKRNINLFYGNQEEKT